jgi:hypothetical protein
MAIDFYCCNISLKLKNTAINHTGSNEASCAYSYHLQSRKLRHKKYTMIIHKMQDSRGRPEFLSTDSVHTRVVPHNLLLLLLVGLVLPCAPYPMWWFFCLGFWLYLSPKCKFWALQHLVVTLTSFAAQREASLHQEIWCSSPLRTVWCHWWTPRCWPKSHIQQKCKPKNTYLPLPWGKN